MSGNEGKDTYESLYRHEHGDATEEADELQAKEDQCQYESHQ